MIPLRLLRHLRSAAAVTWLAAGACGAKVLFVPTIEFSSIGKAMIAAKKGDTIKVDPGVYREQVLLQSGVALIATKLHAASINGGGRGFGVIMGTNTVLDGFDIRRHTVAVVSCEPNAVVRRCRIVYNIQTGLQCIGNLPVVRDNIIAFNGASGVYLWNIGAGPQTIVHNTVAFNANHGIAAGGSSQVKIMNNIIAFNERYAVKLCDDSRIAEARNNILFGNLGQKLALHATNVSTDPLFVAPRRGLDFSLKTASPARGAAPRGADIGSRTAMPPGGKR